MLAAHHFGLDSKFENRHKEALLCAEVCCVCAPERAALRWWWVFGALGPCKEQRDVGYKHPVLILYK